jgi:hypothetical protein
LAEILVFTIFSYHHDALMEVYELLFWSSSAVIEATAGAVSIFKLLGFTGLGMGGRAYHVPHYKCGAARDFILPLHITFN